MLRHSMVSNGTIYPLVVMTTDQVNEQTCDVLRAMGCVVRSVPPWTVDVSGRSMASAHFANVWTKLRAFRLVEYERVVLIDSDMLACGGMDELMNMDLPAGCIAACSACTCNPNRIQTYPANWIPENCAYTEREHGIAASFPMPAYPNPHGLLNSGTVVINPSLEQEYAIQEFIDNNLGRVAQYKFPDQDLLANVYSGRWVPLPWYYNALKTLRRCHTNLWADEQVRMVHYILECVYANEQAVELRSKSPKCTGQRG